MILLRESSHNNDVSVFYDEKKKKYYKVSTSNYGNFLINNELEGIKFFNKLSSQKKIFYKFFKKKNYTRLEINRVNGKIPGYNDSFYKNKKYYEKILNFYLIKWPKQKKQTAHGDFTLDNIIFYKNQIIILDWEHFKISNKLFFGYDLIYLLLSGIILPGEKKFDTESKEQFKKIYKSLYHYGINKKSLNNPFQSIDKIIANVFTNIFIKSPKKFITFSINKNFKEKIITFMDKEVF